MALEEEYFGLCPSFQLTSGILLDWLDCTEARQCSTYFIVHALSL